MAGNAEKFFSLTDMTGQRASTTRTSMWGPLELPFRLSVVLLVSILVGIIPTIMLWALGLGPLSLLAGILVVGGSVWLFYGTANRGLKIHNYVRVWNRMRNVTNQFILGDRPVTLSGPDDWVRLSPGAVTNPQRKILPETLLKQEKQAADPAAAIFEERI